MPRGTDQVSALIPARALAFLEKSLGSRILVSEITGDASTRRFYRARAGRKTAVLIVHPEPIDPNGPLFSNHRVLVSIGAPVPRILATDPSLGLVLAEDLGDVTLQQYLLFYIGDARERLEKATRLYAEACDILVLLHRKGEGALRPGDFAAGCALDCDRFLFELDHFHRHFIVGHRKMTPAPGDEKVLRAFYSDLAQDCDDLPRVYCHRDFQSRNLMVERGRLRLIDFQDARMGPYTYDAASLLRDSSLDLEPALVERMIDRLARALGLEIEGFRRDFDLMALQRNLKDLGTFGYMATVRGRPGYLEYVPRTVGFIKRTLVRSRRYHIVYPVLERYVLS
jgi:N-acetylmuramate 1-kinase